MAIVHVAGQSGRGTTFTTDLTTVMSSTPTNGNTLIAAIGVYNWADAKTVSSIAQTGVTWALATQKTSAALSGGKFFIDSEIWIGQITSGAASTTVVITLSGSPSYGGIADIYEYTNLGVLDQVSAGASGNSANPVTGTTGTTTQADELLIGTITCGAGQTTPTNGFTLYDGVSIASGASLSFLEKIVSATGTYSSGTSQSINLYAGCIATFKGAAVSTAKAKLILLGHKPHTLWGSVHPKL